MFHKLLVIPVNCGEVGTGHDGQLLGQMARWLKWLQELDFTNISRHT